MKKPVRLGVNIDHVATLRQCRKTIYPDPVLAAHLVIAGGADLITCHLREDRRHIQDADLNPLNQLSVPLNLEMAATDEMQKIALALKPHQITLVPEKRQELTTEGGLDCVTQLDRLKKFLQPFAEKNIRRSLFIDPEKTQVEAAIALAVDAVEFHTGTYCERFHSERQTRELDRLRTACEMAQSHGLAVHAGHGLTTENIRPLVRLDSIEEFNIGHSLIARAVMVGLAAAVKEYRKIFDERAP